MKFVCTGDGAGFVEGLGFLNDKDLAKAFSKAHVALYPSRADTFGNVIVESMACGTPAITTSIPAHKEIGGPLMFARPRLEEFTRKLVELYVLWKEHSDVYRKLSQKSLNWAQKYSVNAIFPNFLYMLKAIADGHKG
jgi:glycosyltransferase involved in cell wall biosynthesis